MNCSIFTILILLGSWLPLSAPLAASTPEASTAEASTSAAAPQISPGTTEKVVVDERVRCCRRSYRLHIPSGFEPSGGLRPLVVALHGGLSSSKTFEEQTGFSTLADREDFFVVYPNGMGIGPFLRHWNGGLCCAKARTIDLDDEGFLDRVIERVAATYPIDRQRIYVVGYSNGGMLAHRYAATRADRLAGVGVWGTSIGTRSDGWSWPEPVAPLPTIIAHGLADPRVPWEATVRKEQNLLGAVGSAQAWAKANGCPDDATSAETWDGLVERRTWCGKDDAPVVLLGIEGWDHDWPGPKLNKRPASDPLHRFDLAEEIWRFFSRSH